MDTPEKRPPVPTPREVRCTRVMLEALLITIARTSPGYANDIAISLSGLDEGHRNAKAPGELLVAIADARAWLTEIVRQAEVLDTAADMGEAPTLSRN